MSKRYPYPLTVLMDRYSGIFSGGKFTAWNRDPDLIPEDVYGGDMESASFWEKHYKEQASVKDGFYIIGVGNTPEEAIEDLIQKQIDKGVFIGII